MRAKRAPTYYRPPPLATGNVTKKFKKIILSYKTKKFKILATENVTKNSKKYMSVFQLERGTSKLNKKEKKFPIKMMVFLKSPFPGVINPILHSNI